MLAPCLWEYVQVVCIFKFAAAATAGSMSKFIGTQFIISSFPCYVELKHFWGEGTSHGRVAKCLLPRGTRWHSSTPSPSWGLSPAALPLPEEPSLVPGSCKFYIQLCDSFWLNFSTCYEVSVQVPPANAYPLVRALLLKRLLIFCWNILAALSKISWSYKAWDYCRLSILFLWYLCLYPTDLVLLGVRVNT